MCLPRTQRWWKFQPGEGIGEAGLYQSGKRWKIKRHTCHNIGWKGKENISMLRTWVQLLKFATTVLNYLSLKGIPIDRVGTHLLISGGASALSLAGYSDRDIQKMGRRREETFKEYIRDKLHFLRRACRMQWSKTSNLSTLLMGIHWVGWCN